MNSSPAEVLREVEEVLCAVMDIFSENDPEVGFFVSAAGAALASLRGLKVTVGWASINLTDDNMARDNLCSCAKAGTWNFHADCGHVTTHTPAVLLTAPEEEK